MFFPNGISTKHDVEPSCVMESPDAVMSKIPLDLCMDISCNFCYGNSIWNKNSFYSSMIWKFHLNNIQYLMMEVSYNCFNKIPYEFFVHGNSILNQYYFYEQMNMKIPYNYCGNEIPYKFCYGNSMLRSKREVSLSSQSC